MPKRMLLVLALAVTTAVLAAGCSGSTSSSGGKDGTSTSGSQSGSGADSGSETEFTAEVWADNWFSLYVNGELVGEDSVPITTERSFNSETITFRASYPLTIAMVTKDFKEDDSGLEYIGTDRQQMGDGGFIAQITDTSTGEVVAVTGADWRGLVIHRAPLDKSCESAADPDTACTSESSDEPDGWTEASFDDADWSEASIYSAVEIGTKDGYDTISWDSSAELIWGSDLETDNTILWRYEVAAPS
ncbi:MAG TPA: PEBP family protein [Acidimicrobiia bacterium]|nr:PEBP family protein [Acidimicrobiia bacterium]